MPNLFLHKEISMFNSQIIDVALGLIFIYFFLSLILSVINEWIANKRNWRPQMLYQGLLQLLGGEQQKDLLAKIYAHPLFLGDAPGTVKYAPSYISSRNFALALLQSLNKEEKPAVLTTIEDIKSLVGKLDAESPLKKAILPLVETTGDLETAMKNLEKWYDDAQDRIIGWYKRKSKKCIFWIGLLLCALLNADTFKIAKTFYGDPTLRAGVVKVVEETGPIPDAPAEREKWEKKIIETSKQLNLPLGWCDELPTLRDYLPVLCTKKATPAATAQEAGSPADTAFWLLFKVIGILFTAGAVSLGAPFWFDLMNKVVNLRNAGNRPKNGNQGALRAA
jgi:hypothetical protein